ncbi:DUF1282 domain-containing protein [candidate division KSB1 bacterium]|nr:YIP1 family protein [candidate division KSB1 bacterium]RQW01211.1 MAG: DUF1282 domain-containing protein [candidate division KSB1 bacterium]
MEKLIHEIKELLLAPAKLFERLKQEETSQSEITKTILVYVAAIPAIAGFIGLVVIGSSGPYYGLYTHSRVSIFSGLIWAVVLFVLTIIGVYLVSFIVSGLAPKFGGIKNELNAFKLTVYSFVPLLVLGAFSMIPALSGLFILGLYGIYLFYIGAPILIEIPEEKVLTFTVIVSLISIMITILFYSIAGKVIVTQVPNL